MGLIPRIRMPSRIPTTISLSSIGIERASILFSFVIPALIRWIPEAQFPYPIGFDTPLYISWGRNYASNPTIFPLMQPLLDMLYALGMDMVAVMKYLPTLLYGFLGFSTYRFSRFYLGWNLKKSLLAMLLVSISFVSLRVSWDMHKQLMGTAFLLMALSYLKTSGNPFGFIAFSIFSFLAAFSHELVFVMLMVVLACWVLSMVKREPRKTLPIVSVMSVILLVFVGAWYGWHFIISEKVFGALVLDSTFMAERWFWEATNNTSLFFQLYGLIIISAVLGSFKDKILLLWLCFGLIGSFSTVIFPFYAPSVPPYRWMFLVACPLSFYVTNGFDKLRFLKRKVFKLVGFILILLVINLPTWGFLGFMHQLPYFSRPNVLPETMAQSSIPPNDIEATIWLTKKFDEFEDTILLVHGHYVGWVSYFTGKKIVTFGELYGGDRTIKQAMELAQSENAGDIYLLWYLDSDAYPLGFTKIAEKGSMKLYKYVASYALNQEKTTHA